MALNPELLSYTPMPVPFVNEMFVLTREGVEFEVDKIPLHGGHGGKVKSRGTIFLSNIRMVFVATKPEGGFVAFDMPLLYVHDEKFNQPIFFCNNISAYVEPVVPEDQPRALYSTHTVKILFKEGGCGTFVPLFFNLLASARQYAQFAAAAAAQPTAPYPALTHFKYRAPPVEEMMRHAYVDPNDPSKIYLQQPQVDSLLRRRSYHRCAAEDSI